METRNGHTLYLVIDYDKPLDEDGEQYETYFLNLVDESDLLALLDEDDTVPVCTCKDKCEAGAVNTSCEVCKNNMTECMGKEAEPVTEPEVTPEPEPEPEKKERQRAGCHRPAAGAGWRRCAVLVQAPQAKSGHQGAG